MASIYIIRSTVGSQSNVQLAMCLHPAQTSARDHPQSRASNIETFLASPKHFRLEARTRPTPSDVGCLANIFCYIVNCILSRPASESKPNKEQKLRKGVGLSRSLRVHFGIPDCCRRIIELVWARSGVRTISRESNIAARHQTSQLGQ